MAKQDEHTAPKSTQLGTVPVSVAAPKDVGPTGASAGDYVDGRLTRAGMEKAIRAGGSVVYQGAVISKVESLPDEGDLATTDTEVAAALDTVDAQIAALQARKSKLQAASK